MVKKLIRKTGVPYAKYSLNYIHGCDHDCYFCFAKRCDRRFGRCNEGRAFLLGTAEDLEAELKSMKRTPDEIFITFTSDPFMVGREDIHHETIAMLRVLWDCAINVRLLTKGEIPAREVLDAHPDVKCGITIWALEENQFEGGASPANRIKSLERCHDLTLPTWVSVEPYPRKGLKTKLGRPPHYRVQKILDQVPFVEEAVFGAWTPFNGNGWTYYPDACQFAIWCAARGVRYFLKGNLLHYHEEMGHLRPDEWHEPTGMPAKIIENHKRMSLAGVR